jgi:UDP-N-acetylmuramate dehydrogenase
MRYPDLRSEIAARMPELRGRVAANAPLSDLTWFRVGGPAQALFTPADEADLAYFLAQLPPALAVTVIGLGSNLLVRDGGVPGVVIRLGRGFSALAVEPGHRLRVGAAVPDAKLARAAQAAGISGLAFYRGVPGSVGGALRMNAGAHGSETRDVLVEARAVDRTGAIHVLPVAAMKLSYRHAGAPADLIFSEALFQGTAGVAEEIMQQMQDVAAYREANQPIRERTGGSTFKNPPGRSAWKLIEEAGCRGLVVGGAKVSEIHCNFLINAGNASAEDIERLGETVRARVRMQSGVNLAWEIVRLGLPEPGRPIGEALTAAESRHE